MQSPDAYETLLWDVMVNDRDALHAGRPSRSGVVDLDADPGRVGDHPAQRFSQLRCRHVGPRSAEVLIAQDGRSWLRPQLLRTG